MFTFWRNQRVEPVDLRDELGKNGKTDIAGKKSLCWDTRFLGGFKFEYLKRRNMTLAILVSP